MGGLGGHMAHLSEDLELTFNDLVGILGKVANADLEAVTEKVDGQNLFLTVGGAGDIRAARNAGDIKKGGMTTEEYASKWAGHPAESAFTNGFAAISAALRRLSPQDLSDIFAGGDRYVNMEIMYPGNPNIILYSAPQIVLHGLKYFGPLALKDRSELSDDEKTELRALASASAQKFPYLVRAVDDGQQEVGDELWSINGPKVVALNKLADGSALAEVTEKIETFASSIGMGAQLKDYIESKVRRYAEQVGLPDERTADLLLLMLDREAATDKGITVNGIKKGLSPELRSVVSNLGATTKSRKYIASLLQPIEIAISDFAIEVLRGLKSYFVDEHDEEVVRMRDELQKSIVHLKTLQDAGDENMGALIDKQLSKLGDIENLASSMEGVVFEYPVGSGRIYKLTGAFAMANQIIGRARRSGMTEKLESEFSIKVSADRKVSKSLSEWLSEIEKAKHTYTKLPQSVYEDIMNGSAIVDIVEEKNAMPTIYNAVLTYINGIGDDNGVVLEIIEDDDATIDLTIVDSDVPNAVHSDAAGKTIAVVPGAFKPPHQGHLSMVEQYAAENDEVKVLISNPLKRQRTLADGTVITASHAKAMWDLLTRNMDNVTVEISQAASPITAAYEFIGDEGPLQPGDIVTLGASRKEGDWKRWMGADKYVKDGVEFKDPHSTAVEPSRHSPRYLGILNTSPLKVEMPSVSKNKKPEDKNEQWFHASDMRYLLGSATQDAEAVELLEDFVGGSGEVMELLSILGIDTGLNEPLEETSISSGAITGGAGPVASPFGRSTAGKKKKKKRKQTENIDMSLVNEIYELFIERGIIL